MARVRLAAVPPVPPWVKVVPEVRVKPTESIRDPPWKEMTEVLGEVGRASKSLNQVPYGPPKKGD